VIGEAISACGALIKVVQTVNVIFQEEGYTHNRLITYQRYSNYTAQQ
jgi:hypothetical protein